MGNTNGLNLVSMKTLTFKFKDSVKISSTRKMAASPSTSGNFHRIQKEFSELKKVNGILRHVQINESDYSTWHGVLYPLNPPYNKGAFTLQMTFPTEYPFKPPNIQFLTRIYHPNIDENGSVCLNIINPELWKPTTRVTTIIEELVKLIDKPEPDHPLRTDLAELFFADWKQFMKNAEEFTRKNSEKRHRF